MLELPYWRELRHAKLIAKEVGDILRPNYGNVTGKQQKPDGTWVCEQDLKASKAVLEHLHLYFGDYGVVEEESGRDERSTARTCWVVDPLDGTRGYINGKNPDYSFLLSLLVGLEPVLGLAYKPQSDEMFYAVKDQGAFLEKGGHASQLRISTLDEVIMVTSSHRTAPETNQLSELLQKGPKKFEKKTQSGSSKFLEIVRETATAGYHPSRNETRIWDIAPIQVIVQEAGGVFTCADGKLFDYGQSGTANNRGILCASNEELHKYVLRILQTDIK